jgi:acyl-CoA synthetase (AMP-forming)/AMP-acid ligase II
MKGYYGKQKSNAEWFNTGDSASIKNGMLYIHGRKDDMIIRYGINVYPSEIECKLKSDPRVHEARAFGTRNDSITQKIELHIESDTLSENEAYKLCIELLPETLIPDKIKIVKKIERTASGKVRRKLNGEE